MGRTLHIKAYKNTSHHVVLILKFCFLYENVYLQRCLFFYFQCLQLDRGLVAFLPAQLSSIIDACKLLLFYLQLGGYEPVVEMACGGLFIDSMHTLKHTYACTHALPISPTQSCSVFSQLPY